MREENTTRQADDQTRMAESWGVGESRAPAKGPSSRLSFFLLLCLPPLFPLIRGQGQRTSYCYGVWSTGARSMEHSSTAEWIRMILLLPFFPLFLGFFWYVVQSTKYFPLFSSMSLQVSSYRHREGKRESKAPRERGRGERGPQWSARTGKAMKELSEAMRSYCRLPRMGKGWKYDHDVPRSYYL